MRAFVALCFLALSATLGFGQVNVSTGGPVTSYTTLAAAFTAINGGVHTGNITVVITANTTETVQAVLEASGVGSASYTSVLIYPSVPGIVVQGTPASGAALIQLNGADNVVINGSAGGLGTSRDLTLQANGNATNTAVIYLRSTGAGAGCTNVAIQNCIIRGSDPAVTSTYGICAMGTTITTTGTGADHDNNSVQNCEVVRAYRGISFRAPTTAGQEHNGNQISGNLIGSTDLIDRIVFRGIELQSNVGTQVTRNEIFNMENTTSVNIAGIEVLGTTSNAVVIYRNFIHELRSTSTGGYGAYGINLAGGNNHEVYNNIISDLRGGFSLATTTDLPVGIRITTGTGHDILYNSINLTGTYAFYTGGASTGHCLMVTSTVATGLDVRNNVFAGNVSWNNPGSKFFAVQFPTGYTFSSSTINYNAYLIPATATANTSYFVGRVGTTAGVNEAANLAAWQTLTAQDANSVPSNNGLAAGFTSPVDLHIPNGTTTILESAGTPIATILDDFDTDARNATTPDIGADEFNGLTGDFTPPTVSGVGITPSANQCAPTARTVTASVNDASGIDSVDIVWSVGGVAQTPIGMTFVSGTTWTGTIPAQGAGQQVTYAVRAFDASVSANQATSANANYTDAILNVNAGPNDTLCNGSSYTLTAASSVSPLVISEITLFRTGTGATSPYPAYIPNTGQDDFAELTNQGNASANISGFQFEIVGIGARVYTFPAGTVIPAGGVLVLHIGTGTDSPANNYYNTGGATNSIGSTSLSGFILRNNSGTILDAVATNGYTFLPASGVTPAQWSGSIPSSSGRAGVIFLGTTTNSAADWAVANSPSPLQTIGALNPGVPTGLPTATITWNPGALVGASVVVSPSTTTTYTATITDGTCSFDDQVTLTVLSIPAAPTATGTAVCGTTTATVTATGAGTLRWYADSSSSTILGTGNSYSQLVTGQDTFWVADFNGTCESARSKAIVSFTTPAIISVTATPASMCQGDTTTLAATSGNPLYTYTWTGAGLLATTGASVQANPNTTTVFTVTGTDGVCTDVQNVTVTVNPVPTGTIVGPDSVCNGSTATLSVSSNFISPVRFTEVTLFRIGTGATAPYPAFLAAGDDDFIEITNLSTTLINLSGFQVELVGAGARVYTFPAGTTLAGSAALILHIGTGTDSPVNNYYHTAGTNNPLSSGSLTGFILRTPSGSVVDAVATNGYTFLPASGVTASDWSGNIPSSSGRAGVIRTVVDNNVAADWVLANAPSPLQTIGALNPGLSPSLGVASILWTPGGQTTSSISISPTVNTTYTVDLTLGVCSSQASQSVTVLPVAAAPATTNDTVCGSTPAVLTATGTYTLRWYANPTGGTALATGSTFTTTVSATDTFYVSDENAFCPGPRALAIVVFNTPATITAVATPATLCANDTTVLTASSANPLYTYTWAGAGLLSTTGATVQAKPAQTTTYTVTGTDGTCTFNQPVTVTTVPQPVVDIAGVDSICSGSSTTLQALVGSQFKITEVTQFRTGSGATSPYPAYITGADLVEFTNLGSAPLNISGYRFEVYGTGARTYNFPAGTVVPGGGVVVLHLGTGTDSPANLYFNAGGSNDIISSASLTGYVLKDGTGGNILDVVATNNYAVVGQGGVTAADWSGTIPSSSGRAGVSRTVNDSNTAADWVVSNTGGPFQNVGTANPGLTAQLTTASVTWQPGALTGATVTVSPATTTTYTITTDDGTCTYTTTFTVNVFTTPAAPTMVMGDSTCGSAPAVLTAVGTATLTWFDAPTGGNVVATGSPYNAVISATDTFYVADVNGVCESPRVQAIAAFVAAPAVTVVATPATVCPGGSSTLVASSANPLYAYTWSGPGINGSTGSSVVASPSATTTYTVTGNDGNCADDATVTVNVAAAPILVFNNPDDTICTGGSANLTSSGSVADTLVQTVTVPDGILTGVNVPFNFTAYAGTFNTATHDLQVCFNMTHTWTGDIHAYLISPGNDTLRLIEGDGFGGTNFVNTCFSTTATSSFSSAVAPFTGNFIPEGPGTFGVFDGEPINGTWTMWFFDDFAADLGTLSNWSLSFSNKPGVTVAWSSNPAGLVATTPSVTVTPTVNTTYTVTYSQVAGCSISDSVTISLPGALSATATTSDPVVCPGGSAQLSAVATGGAGPFSFSWDNGLGVGNPVTASPTGLTTYTVTVADNCGSTANASVNVDVVSAPLALNLNNDTAACATGSISVLLNAVATGGDGDYTYTWTNGVPDTAQFAVSLSATTQYNLTVTDGCGDSVQDSVLVEVFPAISVGMGGAGTYCEGSPVAISATGTGGSGTLTYTWNNGLPSQPSHVVSPTSSTTYVVTVTDALGVCSEIDSVVVNIDPLPIAGFTFDDVTNDPTVDFTSTSTNATSLAWDFGDGNTATGATTSHPYDSLGLYVVTLVATNACGSDTAVQTVSVDTASAVSDLLASTISVYPNPANAWVVVSVKGLNVPGLTATLTDVLGKPLLLQPVELVAGNAQVQLDVRNLTVGVYFLQLSTGSAHHSVKLLIER